MESLSKQISAQVNALMSSIKRLGTEEPSFKDGIPGALLADQEAALARQMVLALTDELHCLLSDPENLLGSQTDSSVSTNALGQLKVADTIPIDSPGRKIDDIASDVGLPVDLAKRLMRHAAAHHVFSESAPGFFSHTSASKILVGNKDAQRWLCSGIYDVMLPSFKIPQAIQEWGPSGEPNRAGWNIEHRSSHSAFEGLEAEPERAENFAGAMRYLAKNPIFDMSHLWAGFDWQSLAGKTLTDIGGSAGHASIYLAERVPDLRCIVQDRAKVADLSRDSAPPHLASRVSFESHDMFEDQTRVSDAFLIRLVLHNWSKEYAQKIFKALIPGMKPGSKVLVQDVILPGYGTSMSHYHQKIMRGFDLCMLGLQNGQERDLDDWKELAASVDKRITLARHYKSVESIFGVLEFTFDSS